MFISDGLCISALKYSVFYSFITPDGSQLWAEVNPTNHWIRNCGSNKPGQHRTWNPTTGFKAQVRKY